MTEHEDDANAGTERIAGRRASRKETLPERHPSDYTVQDQDLQNWLDQQNYSAERVVQMEQLRQERPYRWARMVQYAAGGSRERVRLLRVLVEQKLGATYQDLNERLDVSERRIRDFVKELRDADVVETPGRPAQVRFTDDKNRKLAADAVRFL